TCTYVYISYVFLLSSLPLLSFFFLMLRPPPTSTLFPYTTLFRSPRTPPTSSSPDCSSEPAIPSVFHSGCFSAAFRMEAARSFLRSEEHTSELQSRGHLVCRLLLEKKKKKSNNTI